MKEQESRRERQHLTFYRALLLSGAIAYLVWWFAVQALLPGSFNPLGSRLFVVFCFLAIWAGSFISKHIQKNIYNYYAFCFSLLTFHYYYLFYYNSADINWVVGCFITVIAVSACLQQARMLLYYSIFVFVLSLGLVLLDPILMKTIFLSGIGTTLIFANFGVRSRINYLVQLEENSQRMQSLFDAVFEGVVVHDSGYIIEANLGFAHIFGYGLDEVISRPLVDFIAPSLRQEIKDKIVQGEGRAIETVGIKKDGSLIEIEFMSKRHQIQGKSLKLIAFHDITERKKAERTKVLYESSQEALRIRDEFITLASHELKTPLTSIKLQAQLAQRAYNKSDESLLSRDRLIKLVNHMDKQADRLSGLVEDMLDISRISMGKFIMRDEEVDLSVLVRDSVNLLSDSFKQAASELSSHIEEGVKLSGDSFRLEQLIMNLMTNALKYGNQKPVYVELKKIGDQAVFTVVDQGMGIELSNQERIFQKFERAVSARNISGLGLGLFISKQIAEAHSGKIEVKSEVGKGASFIVTLPTPENVVNN